MATVCPPTLPVRCLSPRGGEGRRGVTEVVEHLIRGQSVSPELRARVRELRRTMTKAERALWEKLRGHRLDGFHFRRQQVVAGYIVDFYCDAARLAVEVDGAVHLSQTERDADRDLILAAHGVRVVRFSNEEVLNDLPGVLARLAGWLGETGEPLSP